jgi:PIN domain nuclease of toxin-antitoxin system
LFAQLLIKVRSELPHVELNSDLKERIKAAMVKRYNANLKALDLSRFHTDPGERMVVYNTCRMHIIAVSAVIYLTKAVANLRIQLCFMSKFESSSV